MRHLGEISHPRKRLLELHSQVFVALRREAAPFLTHLPAEIRRYRREFVNDWGSIARRPRAVEFSTLFRAIRSHPVVWIADFHTFGQSQRTALRVLRESVATLRGPNGAPFRWHLGLEMVSTDKQADLDEWQDGHIGDQEFKRRIDYDSAWGFPWENYRPLLAWAIKNGVRLVALNQPARSGLRKKRDNLRARDRWAARKAAEVIRSSSNARIIALYGEWHVSPRHLPAHLEHYLFQKGRRKVKSLCIYQNPDALYWKLAESGVVDTTQLLKLKGPNYCIFSSTPWAKLQSLVTWIEGDFEEERAQIDYLSRAQLYGEAICGFLGVDPPNFGELELVSKSHRSRVAKRLEGSTSETLYQGLLRRERRFYIHEAKLAYLGDASHNSAAEAATRFVQQAYKGSRPIARIDRDGYFRVLLESAFGFLGSLILNPRRKCPLPPELRRRLAEIGKPRGGKTLAEKRAIELALAALKSTRSRTHFDRLLDRTQSELERFDSAETAGRVLARWVYSALTSGDVRPEWVKLSLLRPAAPGDSAYEEQYREVIKALS